MKNYLFLFISLVSISVQAQYVIKSYQSVYEPLQEYNSYFEENYETLFDERFELDFQFPYFEESYNYIDFTSTSVIGFDNSENFNMWLYSFMYTFDEPVSLDDIH